MQNGIRDGVSRSAKWHTRGSEQQRKKHVSAFRAYPPTIFDSFTMPVNIGRKPGFQRWLRPTEPSVLIDRITDDTQIPTSGSYIRFADPREKPPTVFELHLRTNLPRSIRSHTFMTSRKKSAKFDPTVTNLHIFSLLSTPRPSWRSR